MAKPTNYWFKRRRFGYGWVPVTWQGWITILLFLDVVFVGLSILLDVPSTNNAIGTTIYLCAVFISMAAMILVMIKKGPKGKWRWGRAKDDNSKEDF